MFVRVANRILVAGMTAALLIVGSPAKSEAEPLVFPGWDLFQTAPGTAFQGIPLLGVPLVSHDFAGVGVRSTFRTDTIVRRLDSVAAPSGMTGLVIEAMQLRSVAPVPLLGNFMFLTLQSVRGGPDSLGSMTINFGPEGSPHGTFSSSFDVHFDLRLGALDGPIFFSGTQGLMGGADWSHFPSPGAVQIRGVNTFLNGETRLNDFFTGVVSHDSEGAAKHIVEPAVTPEPASLLLVSSGLLGVLAGVRKRRAKKESQ